MSLTEFINREVSQADKMRSDPEKSALEPRLRIVAWVHTLANNDAAADAVKDCDVVAIELSGLSELEREKYDAAATTFVSSSASSADHARARRFLRKGNYVTTTLLESLQGTDKRIITIDANSDAPENVEADKSEELLDKAIKSIHYTPSHITKMFYVTWPF
jgi:hypothetical protein